MYQDYFIYNGNKYYSGTQINILQSNSNNTYDLAYFIYYDVDYDAVWYQIACTNQLRFSSMKTFLKNFGGVTGKVEPAIHPPVEKKLKDSQIPKLFFGWCWYIFIMLLLFIFKEAIFGWIISSIVFFSWRSDVIEKEGYYIER